MSPPQKPTDRKQKRRRKARKDVAAMSTAPPEDGALVERKRQQQQQQQHDSRVDSSSISNSNKTRDQGSGQNKAVLSGKLYRCAPLFAPSSNMVFCACSATVLALSVDTGEELFRLVGHTKQVTGMLLLPEGSYGASGKRRKGGTASRFLLTCSLDGKLRLWNISADLMSLEGELKRCLRVFTVGMAVYHLYLGRTDNSGAALDVIVVTQTQGKLRWPSSSLSSRSSDSGSRDNTEGSERGAQINHGDGNTSAPDGQLPPNNDQDKMDDEDSNHDSDQGDQTDREEESDGEDTVTENEGESEDADNVDLMEGGVLEKRTQENGKEAGTGEGTRSLGGKGRGVGKKPRKRGVPLFDWQAVRYGLEKGEAQKILIINQRTRRWIGAVSPRSPIRQHASGSANMDNVDARRNSGVREAVAPTRNAPVLVVGQGRALVVVDTESGERVVLLNTMAPVTSVVVGGDGEQVVTGHIDGRMTQWTRLYQRIGAAFGVPGFEGAMKQPSTDMHWHDNAVRCMTIAPDGVQLLSGGREGVLVQWNLSKGTKAFIPRLGATVERVAMSPNQEHAVVATEDNAVSLVGLAGWDVMWQLRGLALNPRIAGGTRSTGRGLKLAIEPRRGLLVCNGRPGHLQFYNPRTDCLEGSAEVLRVNRHSSGNQFVYHRGKKEKELVKASSKIGAPVVEHVAFSRDGERMVAVASRHQHRQRQYSLSGRPAPALSFWILARGSDPYSGGYTGSYTGGRVGASAGMAGRGHGEGGTSGHWASDTTVENPHGRGTYVMALEYHPREDLAVTAGENGSFNLWGLKRNTSTVESLAATAAGVEGGGKGDDNPKTHWACTLSVRYKAGLSASALSFCSDGSVLAVSYTPLVDKKSYEQGVVTLWSLETATLISTLLPPKTSLVRAPSLAFLSGSARIFSAGAGYAAVWDLVSEEATPLWQYRLGVRATATANLASVQRSGKAGIEVPGRGFGDVALSIDASSLMAKADNRSDRSRRKTQRGTVVLLLNASRPTPLFSWRLRQDRIVSAQLLLGSAGSNAGEGVLGLTKRGELLLLSVLSGGGDRRVAAPGQQVGVGLSVVSMLGQGAAIAPALNLSTAGKRKLLEVDLAGSDPALAGIDKRVRADGFGEAEGFDDEEEGIRHMGGREAALRSGLRASDILDPSSINLAPVPDLYQAFMKTLLKPAPEAPNTVALGGRQQRQQTAAARKGTDTGGASDGSTAGKANRHGWWGAGVVAGKGSSRAVMDHGLLAALSAKMKADRGGDT